MIKYIISFLMIPMTVFCKGRTEDRGKSRDVKPNIIFILTDDQRWNALGYAGNKIIHTPALNKLAKQGTYFSHAMATTPICAASRASILTGYCAWM